MKNTCISSILTAVRKHVLGVLASLSILIMLAILVNGCLWFADRHRSSNMITYWDSSEWNAERQIMYGQSWFVALQRTEEANRGGSIVVPSAPISTRWMNFFELNLPNIWDYNIKGEATQIIHVKIWPLGGVGIIRTKRDFFLINFVKFTATLMSLSLVFYLAFMGMKQIVQEYRMSRKSCLNCGYPIESKCPECGSFLH